MKGYAKIAQPLTTQLKKDYFGQSLAATESFTALKRASAAAPMLAMPDFSQPFILESDASGFGVRAVLLQGGHPIAYYNKLLGPRARNQSIYDKAWSAVQKWKHYLLGRHFVIHLGQHSLRHLMAQREVGTDYERWMGKLMDYDFEIKYKSGPSNKLTDALSRQFSCALECGALISSHSPQWSDTQSADPFIQQLKSTMEEGQHGPKDFTLTQGVLRYKGRIVIPNKSALVQQILHEYHDSPSGGHFGDFKTYQPWCQNKVASRIARVVNVFKSTKPILRAS